MSSTFPWSAASEDSNSEWSKSNSWPRAVLLRRRRVPVLLDRRLLKLRVALEPKRLREADDGRGRGAGATGQLLGGLEGGLVEMVDDVAGHVLLRARELVEALGDVGRQALSVRPRLPAVARLALRVRAGWDETSWPSCSRRHDSPCWRVSLAGRRTVLRPVARGSDVVGSVLWTLERALRLTNRNMIAFDLVLGSAAILAPSATLPVLGHDRPSADAEHLFRRCGPIWLTFAAAHAVADRRDDPRTGGRSPGCEGPSLRPTRCGRARRPSRDRARGPGCSSPARPTWR